MITSSPILLLLLGITILLGIVILVVVHQSKSTIKLLRHDLDSMKDAFRFDFRNNREEAAKHGSDGRKELMESLHYFKQEMSQAVNSFGLTFDKNVTAFNNLQREKFADLQTKQTELIRNTEDRLERIRETVEEKLQKTLNERLGHSFALVGQQLESVQKGLGEMQAIAQDVGGLKRILSNVKMRGGLGEVQLSMLLENILSPDQYAANVKTKQGSNAIVEFAIRLPNSDSASGTVWLPIDAKFPREAYEKIQDAYEVADVERMAEAHKQLETVFRSMAKDISTKYLDPPATTDFAILFLPFEGIYAEVVRKPALLESLQREFKILITGPSTLGALLNSLQMGFRTLAIQKRTAEVWQVLASVKKEFDNFSGMLDKARNQLHQASTTLEDVAGRRSRAIHKKLKGIEAYNPQIEASEVDNDEEQ